MSAAQGLFGSGFDVEPETLLKLQPQERAVLTVSTRQEKEGTFCVPLEVQVSDGPTYQIHLSANFVVPDLQLSADLLDFGSVRRGLWRLKVSALSLARPLVNAASAEQNSSLPTTDCLSVAQA